MAILNENDKKLFNSAVEKLIKLPLHRRSDTKEYLYKYFNKLTDSKSLEDCLLVANQSQKENCRIESIEQTYQIPNFQKRVMFYFNGLSNKYKVAGLIAGLFLILGFLIEINYPFLKELGDLFLVMSSLIFTSAYAIPFIKLSIDISNIFGNITNLLKDAKKTVVDCQYIKKKELNDKVNIIVKIILEDEITRIEGLEKTVREFSILFIVYVYLGYILIVGDSLNDIIKIVDTFFCNKGFSIIHKINLEIFLKYLFPIILSIPVLVFSLFLNSRKRELVRSLNIHEESI